MNLSMLDIRWIANLLKFCTQILYMYIDNYNILNACTTHNAS
jgi:hypothetical protein